MFPFSFKNRIAFNYILSTGLLISIVFIVFYQIISYVVYKHIDDYLQEEILEHSEEIIENKGNGFVFQVDKLQEEADEVDNLHPVFEQLLDTNYNTVVKSPNLKELSLKLNDSNYDNLFYDTYLDNQLIRQVQTPIVVNNEKVGFLIIAISLEEASALIKHLQEILLIIFPLFLIILFLVARIIAGKSIKPIIKIQETASKITKDNLNERIELPKNKDELYVLSKTINELLERIENAVEREKQFTSDASHELKTPLTILKGTLEVLVKKPRTQTEYEEKIQQSIIEVNRLNKLVEQLLLLARFENLKQNLRIEKVPIDTIILETLSFYSDKIKSKNIKITTSLSNNSLIESDYNLVSIVIGNILSNAIKYSNDSGEISISIAENNNTISCKIADKGIGISKSDLSKIQNPFFRSNHTKHSDIKGTGLGLSIVKRICELLKIEFTITSEFNKGTTVILNFFKETLSEH